MFGRVNRSSGDTTWVNFNGKTGLFTIDHNAQNAEGTYREHKTTTGRTVFKEEYPDMISAYVRRVMIREEDSYNKPGEKEHKIAVSLRSPDGKDAVVKFGLGSSALQVLGAINAADLSKPITLKCYFFEKGSKGKDKEGNEVVRDKDEVRLVGYQGDEKLKNEYGGDIPKAEKIEVKNASGKVIDTAYDFSAQQEFTLALARAVDEKAKEAAKAHPAPTAPSATPAPAAVKDEHDPALSASDILGTDDGGAADAAAFAETPAA